MSPGFIPFSNCWSEGASSVIVNGPINPPLARDGASESSPAIFSNASPRLTRARISSSRSRVAWSSAALTPAADDGTFS